MNDERLMQYRQYNREECLLRIRADVYDILDNTKFNRVHVKTVIVTGLGFLTVNCNSHLIKFNMPFNNLYIK